MVAITRYILIPAIFILLCVRKYRERQWGKCTNKVRLKEKLAVVTGANSGIGYEIAKELAIRGAHVIMACRDLEKAADAICEIKREIQCTSVIIPMKLDLGSIESIKNFSDEVTLNYGKIDLLINNAGISYPRNGRRETKDGFEIHFGVNYLGHYLLTNLLLTPLSNAEKGRIIVISSGKHEQGVIDLHDLSMEKTKIGTDAYANSKLALVYFCKELTKRLKYTNIGVYVVSPGWVYTNLFRYHNLKWYQILLSIPVAYLFMRTPKQGAQTAIFCATEPYLESGCMYKDCQKYSSKFQFDHRLSNCLWYKSQDMVDKVNADLGLGIKFVGPFC
ncbi:hypothetical protein FQA39_LY12670 [Lamprigera yunnana]|nr:hypothetical protein FQA39_LY12670 [Lamprigera yunnana]